MVADTIAFIPDLALDDPSTRHPVRHCNRYEYYVYRPTASRCNCRHTSTMNGCKGRGRRRESCALLGSEAGGFTGGVGDRCEGLEVADSRPPGTPFRIRSRPGHVTERGLCFEKTALDVLAPDIVDEYKVGVEDTRETDEQMRGEFDRKEDWEVWCPVQAQETSAGQQERRPEFVAGQAIGHGEGLCFEKTALDVLAPDIVDEYKVGVGDTRETDGEFETTRWREGKLGGVVSQPFKLCDEA
ncbi:hypothetical protein BC938DRAFT_476857, partial [Jimgerdemannia flammicorona]